MWQKIKDFGQKDPIIFVLIFVVLFVGGTFGGLIMMHQTSTAKFCQTCHAAEKVGVRGEYYTWDKNIHSEVGASCLDCHGSPGVGGYMYAHVIAGQKSLISEIFNSEETIVKNLTHYASDVDAAAYAAPDASCLFCHSDSYNEKYRRERVISAGPHFRMIDDVKNPEYRNKYGRPDLMTEGVSAGVDPNHKKHVEELGLSCSNCHIGVAHGGERYNLPEMQTCFTCHDDKRAEYKAIPANEDCAACHTLQKNVQQGTAAKGVEETQWYMADLSCDSCHSNTTMRPNTDSCSSCHEDASYAGIMIDTQKAFAEKAAKIVAVRDSLFKVREEMPAGKRALFNELHMLVRIVEKDGSQGIHNPEYFDAIFEAADAKVEAIKTWTPPVVVEEEKAAAPVKKEEKKEEVKPAFAGNSEELMGMLEGSEVINLAERFVKDPKKKAVKFEHKAHAEKLACTSCHKEAGDSELVIDVSEVKGMSNPFHKELCISCHKEKKVKKSCSTCHK